MSQFVPKPQLPPPASTVGVVGWLRGNLFSSPLNIALTLFSAYLLYITIPPALSWAIFNADWFGTTQDDCTSSGACWVAVMSRTELIIYGFFPAEEYWRIDLLFLLLAALFVPQFFEKFPYKFLFGVLLLTVFPVIATVLLLGGILGIEPVETSKWGGLMLTLALAFVGIVAAFPIGVVLALGRRSQMVVIRNISIGFIELVRGVPLITVLFMASVMLPLFLPEGVNFNKLLRALIGIVLFQAAYLAETVRGGLQAIPKGQIEAANALGLSYWRTMGLIVLPQALKLVIPGIVNSFISLFKDTTLVLIIGLLDILASVQVLINDPSWGNIAKEGYVAAAFIFWIFCFGMSRYSQALERRLETGHKR